MGDVKRLTELFLVKRLVAAVPTMPFYPMTGFGKDNPELDPPFVVVAVDDPAKMFSTQETYQGSGTIQIITHSQDTTAEDHSAIVKAVYDAFVQIQPGTDTDYIFHGQDISGMRYADHPESQCHVDQIDFSWGATG